MATISLLWNTNMAVVMSVKTLYKEVGKSSFSTDALCSVLV